MEKAHSANRMVKRSPAPNSSTKICWAEETKAMTPPKVIDAHTA